MGVGWVAWIADDSAQRGAQQFVSIGVPAVDRRLGHPGGRRDRLDGDCGGSAALEKSQCGQVDTPVSL
jgi:hypothetical protein